MKKDGECFKKIRMSRGISQNNVVQNKLSRVTLSKFENNKITLSMNNFKYILNSIDVTLEEFDYIKNNYSYDEKENIINQFNRISTNLDDISCDNLIVKCDKYLKEYYSITIKCIKDVLYMLKYINNSSNEKISCHAKIYAADVWAEMSKIDDWNLLDMKLINCCLHFFEPKTYISIGQLLTKNLKKYKDFSNIELLESSIYLNLTILFLGENQVNHATIYSKLALEKSLKSKRIDYIALSLVRYGIIMKDKKLIEKGINLLKLLNNEELEKQVNDEIKFFK